MRRALAFLVHNWPLKLAAIVLATLLYAGLVLSQNARVFTGGVQILPENQPDKTVLMSDPGTVSRISYLASNGAIEPSASSFRATVDLSKIDPAKGGGLAPVTVISLDPTIRVLEYSPNAIPVQLDPFISRRIPVQVDTGQVPQGLDVRPPSFTPTEVDVSGPQTRVQQVVAARASVLIEPSGINVDRDVPLAPVDVRGDIVREVSVDPVAAHVTIPVFRDAKSRSVPVNPTLTGTPPPGFAIGSVTVSPPTVLIEGNADTIGGIEEIATAAVSLTGATKTIEATVALQLPDGVVVPAPTTVTVTVTLHPVAETRNVTAAIELTGMKPDLAYDAQADRVVLAIFGSPVDLDRLTAAPITVHGDVSTLTVGSHEVTLEITLPAGLQLVSISPPRIVVLVTAAPLPTPSSPSASPTST